MKRDTLVAGITTLALMALAAVLMAAAIQLLPTEAAGATNVQTCSALHSGKIDVSGDHETVTVTAPAGKLIDRYCVKAGSARQGDGPEFVNVDPAQAVVVIAHSSGKDVSHYSVRYVDAPAPPTTEPPATTVPPTTEPPATTVQPLPEVPGVVIIETPQVILPPSPAAEAVPGTPTFTG